MKIKKPAQQLYEDLSDKMKKVLPIADIELKSTEELLELQKVNQKLLESPLTSDIMGSDLDVPGSEDDDEDEEIGSEDEENNYYSLGGDNHNNLDETDNTNP